MDEQQVSAIDAQPNKKSWLNDACCLGLLFLVFVANFMLRPVELTIRGEESRRGRIAWEMLHSGDWVVSTLQAEPRLTRPPLHYWAIAICGYLRGEVDAWAIRWPSFLSVLATGFLVYWYVRQHVSAISAFFAGMSAMTFGQVLQLGRLGESDATFMFLMAGSLLIWHGGRIRGWSPWAYHSMAYLFLAGATLAKGPQGPVYFAGTVGLYLISTRRWKELFSPAHLTGVFVFLILINSWHLLFLQQLSLKALYVAYFGEVEKRFTDASSLDYFLHLLQYPLELLGAAMFPWSILLLAFSLKTFRVQFLKQDYPYLFPILAMCVAWPTVWLPASSNTRYFMCMLPCVAVILGYLLETIIRCVNSTDSAISANIKGIWQRFNWTMMTLFGAVCLGLIGIKFVKPAHVLSDEQISIFILFAGIALMVHLLRASLPKFWVQLILYGMMIGTLINGPYLSILSEKANHAYIHVEKVRQLIPQNQQLVSLGLNHHLFTFYWNAELPIVRPQPNSKTYTGDISYFCYHNPGNKPLPDFGFTWEELARVNCDRNVHKEPFDVVIVGKVTKLAHSLDTSQIIK